MNKQRLRALIASSLFAAGLGMAGAAHAELTPYGGISTLGLNLGVKHQYNENFAVRAGINTYTYGVDLDEGNVRYDGDLKMKSAELLADWHPFGGGFHVSAGLLYNDNTIEASARGVGGTFTVNDVVYNGANARANFKARLDGNKVSPYVGVGYTVKPKSWGGFQLYANAGVIHQDIKTSLSVSGIDDPTGTLNADVKAARKKLQDEADKYNLYPVVNVGVGYTF